ncbi:IS30 family transposase IS4351 [Methanolapillus millepedarum]|uniref:IS30 family transposase IS4351 n=2 Tax=Methanolapillus millepedarum TaxID=3028296 RepID=A0AA96ZVU4_9EURY|nr:IS30 family transposase IS4351 [Methanosarcinaceae archaeon Ac7]
MAERIQISIYSHSGKTQTEIAAALGRSQSTVSRELRRNQPPKNTVKYNAQKAHERSTQRKLNAAKKERLKDPVIKDYAHDKIRLGWSPEQIAGRINIDLPGKQTNYETIYLHLYQERTDLIQYLPKRHRKRKKRGLKIKNRVGKIPDRISIDERPEVVNERSRAGDLEIDTVWSRRSSACLQVIVDRVTHFTWINLLKDKSAMEMVDKAIQCLKDLPPELRRTITFDNGTENAAHRKLKEILDIDTYFCHPYHSWEKGTVENTIGIIRRIFPKSTDFSKVTVEQIK